MSGPPYRLYAADELGADGYPPEWHAKLKHEIRERAGHRCVRCHHPYRCGENGKGEWTRCDERCSHGKPLRVALPDGTYIDGLMDSLVSLARRRFPRDWPLEARWRILTVHHLDGDKANCRWWNLAALCQRCHLRVQGRVVMARVWPWEHSDWFKPYVAGYYAHAYLGEDLTREAVETRLEELLALERDA